MNQEGVSLTLAEVYDLAHAALTAQGISEPQSAAIAELMVREEQDECHSHGLFRIPFYVKALTNKYVDRTAEPSVRQAAPGIIRVDAKFGFAPYALKLGIPPLIEAARRQGVAALSINNAYHIASLWPEIETITAADLVGFAFTNSLPAVAPAGGTKALFGTNPMAFGWPRRGSTPLVFDQASSVVAKGEVLIHKRDGKPIPAGWAIGPDGKSTTDPAAALEGALLPFGGHKGSAIAMMVELLAGALIGDLFSHEVAEREPGTTAPCGGELLIALDPGLCAGGQTSGQTGGQADEQKREAQDAHAEKLFAKLEGEKGARLPSGRRYAARRRTSANGVRIPEDLHKTLKELGRSR